MPDGLLILGWHNAQPTPFYPSPAGAAERGLWRQLKTVTRLGRVVDLETAVSDIAAGRPLPRRAVALTFDDGYRDNLETVVPMLTRLGLSATFFLVTGLLDRTARPWWETVAWAFSRSRRSSIEWRGRVLPAGESQESRATMLAMCEELKLQSGEERGAAIDELIEHLDPRGSEDEVAELFLDWDGARRLAHRQTIGSHTTSHHILSAETAETQTRDLAESRQRLQREFDREIATIAYPNGTAMDYDDATLAAARAAGYAAAVTTIDGWNRRSSPLLELRRFVLEPPMAARGLGHAIKRKAVAIARAA